MASLSISMMNLVSEGSALFSTEYNVGDPDDRFDSVVDPMQIFVKTYWKDHHSRCGVLGHH